MAEVEEKNRIYRLKKDNHPLFKTKVRDEEFIFRPLTKIEYEEFVGGDREDIGQDHELAEKICELCVVYPKDYDYEDPTYGGVPESVMSAIIEQSGFYDEEKIEELLATYTELNAEDHEYQIINTILAVFPQVSLSDTRQWTMEQIVEHYTRAVWVINNIRTDMQVPMGEEQQDNPAQNPMENEMQGFPGQQGQSSQQPGMQPGMEPGGQMNTMGHRRQ